jgi:hypothetical protein
VPRKLISSAGWLLVVVAMMFGCGSESKLTADQQRGKRIYESLCDKCHKLIPPKQHTDDEWTVTSEKYGLVLKLQPNEISLLKAYLLRANDTDY